MATSNSVNTGLSGASGSGSFAGNVSPSFTTPILGTPTSGNLANCTGVSLTAGVSGILPVANGGTNASSASITAFNNITGYTAAGATGTTSTNLVFSTSPTLTTPRIGQINDTNGNASVVLSATTNAVNYFTLANSSAGTAPQIASTGSDTDIDVTVTPKGAGKVSLNTKALTLPLSIVSGTGGQHTTTFNFSDTSATRAITFPDAGGTLLITGTAINSVPSIAFSSTSGVIGTTTNDSAASGSVGQLISSAVANTTVSLSNGTVANVTSISLTAGDWLVHGNLAFTGNAATTTIYTQGAISLTSATLPANHLFTGQFYSSGGTLVYATAGSSFCVPVLRVSISGTTTVYLCAQSGFGVSTTTVGGQIQAYRTR